MDENMREWLKSAVGCTEEEVTEAVLKGGCIVRVRSRDGERYLGTCDLVQNRANLTIEKGIVIQITFG